MQEELNRMCEELGGVWDDSGFLQLKCLIFFTASKAKSWMVTGTGNMSIVMLSK